jgi:aminopeptidase C
MSAILAKHPGSPGAVSSAGVLSPGFLDALRASYVMSEADRACHNAVTHNDTNSLALNRAVLRGDDGHFSHRIKSQGITDQKKSGRCWMFAALTRFHAGASCHAMAIMGVDLAADGRPRKWLVENSHGDEVGNKGQWTLHDKWFDEHVYTIIVHQRHVPAAILQRFEEEPTELPVWYPGAEGSRFQNQ